MVSIPKEILIFEKNYGGEIFLNNNSIIKNGFLYILKENKALIKTSKFYTIENQFILKEFELSNVNPSSYLKIYYGRIHRLIFKLCHGYC